MNVDWKEVGHVAAAGAIGGLLSWIYSLVIGTPIGLGSVGSFLAAICLGSGAGILGVYLVAKTDMQAALHGLVFAMACGFSWKPVYEASGALVHARIDQQNEEEVERDTDQARKASKQLTGDARDAGALEESVAATRSALLVPVKNVDSLEERSRRLEDVVLNITHANGFTVEERIDSLRAIGSTAASAGDQGLAFLSVQAITELSGEEGVEQMTRNQAASAVEAIGDRGVFRMPALDVNSKLIGTKLREGTAVPQEFKIAPEALTRFRLNDGL